MTGGKFRRLCLGLALSLLATPVLAASRGIEVTLRQSERAGAPVAETVRLYGASYALVIGIDNYTAGWPRLANAVKDAELVAAELAARGFEVRLEIDLDSLALQRTLKEFFALKGADPEARLLLWFAGHGQTLDGEGFLVPADAPPANDPGFLVKALHMRDFGGLTRLARAKHVLSVFDSCFSGTVFSARAGAAPAAITRKTTQPVRQFLTSGDAGQQVRDDGSFAKLFVRALRGEEPADVNADGYVTGEELGLFLSQRMAALTNAAQTPRYGKLQDVKYDRGDFVFALPGAAHTAPQSAKPGPGADREALFWQTIKDSEQAADFCAYLEAFPDGTFVPLARLRCPRQTALVVPAKPPVELEPIEAAYVAVKNANVRAEPTVRSAKVATLRRGTSIHVAGKVKDRNWYLVERGDKPLGYVYGELLMQPEAAKVALVSPAKPDAPAQAKPPATAPMKESVRLRKIRSEVLRILASEILPEANRSSDGHGVAYVLGYVVSAFVQAGDLDRALRIAGNMSVDGRASPLSGIAVAQANAGDMTAARRTFDSALRAARGSSEKDMFRSWTISAIASSQARAGELAASRRTIDEATRIIARISEREDRDFPLQGVAGALAWVGDVDAAYRTANTISAPDDRSGAFQEIARAQKEGSDPTGARRSLDYAFGAARQISNYYRGWHLSLVAKMLAELGDRDTAGRALDEAMRVASGEQDTNGRDFVMIGVVRAQLELGDFGKALRTADRISSASWRSGALADIAVAQAKSGDLAAARATIDDATRVAGMIESSDSRDDKFSEIAGALAAIGDVDEAMSTANRISNPRSRASAYSSVLRQLEEREKRVLKAAAQ